MQADFAHFVVVFHHNVRSVGLSSLRVGLNNAWYKSRVDLCIYYKVELLTAECYVNKLLKNWEETLPFSICLQQRRKTIIADDRNNCLSAITYCVA